MRYLTADRIHNGRNWIPEGCIIAVTEKGLIDSIIQPDSVQPEYIRHFDGILCPGFVNVHCHLELSHMKGIIAEGNSLVPFLQAVMLDRNNFSEEEKIFAMEAALEETRNNGIVAVGDIANGTDTIPYRQDAGFHIHTFVESIGFTETQFTDRFTWPVNVYQKFREQVGKEHILRQSIVPHAPYSVSEGMFSLINNFEKESLLSIHNEETEAENDFYRTKTGSMFDLYQSLKIDASFFQPSGKTSLQTYLPQLSSTHPVILVHNTFMDQEDIAFLKQSERDVYLCLCPNANWYIERKMPPVELLLSSDLPVCLGTDSLASNHQLSIWSEIQILQQHFPQISLETLLCCATYNGARALKLEEHIGSLEPGKRPGLIHVSGDGRIKRII